MKTYINLLYQDLPTTIMFDSFSTFMTDSQFLGTIQISQNLNEHHYYLTSAESLTFHLDANQACQ